MIARIAKPNSESILEKLGPGLITGAADDDPSGIAAYSQSGAQFGYSLLWTLIFTYPLMVGIQLVSARIGRVSGYGLAGNIRRHYPAPILYGLVGLLLVANTINIGADISAMADTLAILIGGPRHAYIVAIGVVCVVLEVFISYVRYVRVLKWFTLSLFAYVGVVFAVDIPWAEVLREADPSHKFEGGVRHYSGCHFWNDHQSISILLASVAGMRRVACGQSRQTPAQPS
jgi:NRAMP (natural resistance-associated macrophage protein)-like metal ion transporter